MKENHIIKGGLLACLLALAAQPAVAGLKITLVNEGGEPPPPEFMAGGGNLPEIMDVAAKRWERVFNKGGSQWNLTVRYVWTNNLGNDYGRERMIAEGGKDVARITESRILFNNDPGDPFVPGAVRGYFADPTPKKNSYYTLYQSPLLELHDFSDSTPLGEINVGRFFSGAKGPAIGRIDLLTIATHEIGHALGLDNHYSGHTNQFVDALYVLITPPLPFAGFGATLTGGVGDHIFISFLPPALPLMVPHAVPGTRQLITDIDTLVIAQFSSVDRPNFGEPQGAPKVQVVDDE